MAHPGVDLEMELSVPRGVLEIPGGHPPSKRGEQSGVVQKEKLSFSVGPTVASSNPTGNSGAKMALQIVLSGPEMARPLYPCICRSSEAGPPGEGVTVSEASLCS